MIRFGLVLGLAGLLAAYALVFDSGSRSERKATHRALVSCAKAAGSDAVAMQACLDR